MFGLFSKKPQPERKPEAAKPSMPGSIVARALKPKRIDAAAGYWMVARSGQGRIRRPDASVIRPARYRFVTITISQTMALLAGRI